MIADLGGIMGLCVKSQNFFHFPQFPGMIADLEGIIDLYLDNSQNFYIYFFPSQNSFLFNSRNFRENTWLIISVHLFFPYFPGMIPDLKGIIGLYLDNSQNFFFISRSFREIHMANNFHTFPGMIADLGGIIFSLSYREWSQI